MRGAVARLARCSFAAGHVTNNPKSPNPSSCVDNARYWTHACAGTAEQTLALRHAQEMQQMQELVPRMAEAVAHRSQLNKAKTVLAVLRHEEEELRIARATFEGNVAAVVCDVGRVVQGLRAPRPPLHAV